MPEHSKVPAGVTSMRCHLLVSRVGNASTTVCEFWIDGPAVTSLSMEESSSFLKLCIKSCSVLLSTDNQLCITALIICINYVLVIKKVYRGKCVTLLQCKSLIYFGLAILVFLITAWDKTL